jgi:hypothetical protein
MTGKQEHCTHRRQLSADCAYWGRPDNSSILSLVNLR